MEIIARTDIVEKVKLNEVVIAVIEQAFNDLVQKKVSMPPIMRIDVPENNGEVDIKSAYIEGDDSFAIKISSGFFDNPKLGMPSANGMMLLLSAETGIPKAVLADNGYLTDIRTAAAGAVAAKYLTKRDSKVAGIIGTGAQARLQLQALTLVRDIEKAYVYGRSPDKAQQYKREMEEQLGIPVEPVSEAAEAVRNSDVVVTTTPATKPIVEAASLHKGVHITAMGSDAEHKQELSADVLEAADLFVCDVKDQSTRLGELRAATSERVERDAIELGEITTGKERGRTKDDQITICDLTGIGVQDTAIARYTYHYLFKELENQKVD
ncbi:cyclodeaminase [Terrihalobacillus insolitus]|uniref:cyclodeaminase n=1 Tax=Terrihalobacillus insolitus TaxID=2950438 RepID=UPI002FEE647B